MPRHPALIGDPCTNTGADHDQWRRAERGDRNLGIFFMEKLNKLLEVHRFILF